MKLSILQRMLHDRGGNFGIMTAVLLPPFPLGGGRPAGGPPFCPGGPAWRSWARPP